MGNVYSSFSSHSFDVLQGKIMTGADIVLINTLLEGDQDCLIKSTITAFKENEFMNDLLKKNKTKEIIIYGKNHKDLKIIQKYNQLKKLGFTNVFIYFGGLFEWLLLQEVYGESNFQTDGKVKDLLRYK